MDSIKWAVNTIAVLTSWKALELIGPTFHGFVGKIQVLAIITAGILFLGERFNKNEVLSGLLVLSGIVIMSYTKGNILSAGVMILTFSSVFFASHKLIIKSKLMKIDPMVNVSFRAMVTFLFLTLYAIITDSFQISYNVGLVYATIPALFSAVLNHYFTFKAYKYLEISKFRLIGSINPIIIALLSFIVFGETLNIRQRSGGLVIVIGMILLVLSRKKIIEEKPANSVLNTS